MILYRPFFSEVKNTLTLRDFMFGTNTVKERVLNGILYCYSGFGIQVQQSIQQIFHDMIETIDYCHISECQPLYFLRQLQFVAKESTLFVYLVAIESGQLDDVIDEVSVPDSSGLVHHPHVVEDIVLADHKLEKDDPYWPHV